MNNIFDSVSLTMFKSADSDRSCRPWPKPLHIGRYKALFRSLFSLESYFAGSEKLEVFKPSIICGLFLNVTKQLKHFFGLCFFFFFSFFRVENIIFIH